MTNATATSASNNTAGKDGIQALLDVSMAYVSEREELSTYNYNLVSDTFTRLFTSQINVTQASSIINPIVGSNQPMQKVSAILSMTEEPIPVNPRGYNDNLSRHKTRPWMLYEDQRLLSAIWRYGLENWMLIAEFVGNGRTRSQCSQRWNRGLNPKISKGSWSKLEEEKLLRLVQENGDKSWTKIAMEFGNRSDVQCRYKYQQLMKENNSVSFSNVNGNSSNNSSNGSLLNDNLLESDSNDSQQSPLYKNENIGSFGNENGNLLENNNNRIINNGSNSNNDNNENDCLNDNHENFDKNNNDDHINNISNNSSSNDNNKNSSNNNSNNNSNSNSNTIIIIDKDNVSINSDNKNNYEKNNNNINNNIIIKDDNNNNINSNNINSNNVIPNNVVPNNAAPNNALSSNVMPSNVMPSNVMPSNVMPSNVIANNSISSNNVLISNKNTFINSNNNGGEGFGNGILSAQQSFFGAGAQGLEGIGVGGMNNGSFSSLPLMQQQFQNLNHKNLTKKHLKKETKLSASLTIGNSQSGNKNAININNISNVNNNINNFNTVNNINNVNNIINSGNINSMNNINNMNNINSINNINHVNLINMNGSLSQQQGNTNDSQFGFTNINLNLSSNTNSNICANTYMNSYMGTNVNGYAMNGALFPSELSEPQIPLQENTPKIYLPQIDPTVFIEC